MAKSEESFTPRWMYKRGTGTVVSAEDGLCTAEAVLVNSAEELAALGGGWCDSPAAATTGAPKSGKGSQTSPPTDPVRVDTFPPGLSQKTPK